MSPLRDISNSLNEPVPGEKRKHNKSGKDTVNVSTWTDDEYNTYEKVYERTPKIKFQAEGRGYCSQCELIATQDGTPLKDGRLTYKSKKVCHGYQLVARKKFGVSRMQQIASSKRQEDITISHLCGTRNCCNPRHLVLESKATNDARTVCHKGLDNYFSVSKKCAPQDDIEKRCPHKPLCGSDDNAM